MEQKYTIDQNNNEKQDRDKVDQYKNNNNTKYDREKKFAGEREREREKYLNQ